MSIRTITLTSKRQTTLPAKLCRELGVRPGDKLSLKTCMIEGEPAWVIQNPKSVEMPWLGSLSEFADKKSDEMDDIRRSIGKHTGQKQ